MGLELLSTPVFQRLGMVGLGQGTSVSNPVLATDARKGSTLKAFEKRKQRNPNGALEGALLAPRRIVLRTESREIN